MNSLNILAIDPAQRTGFAWSDGIRRHSGFWLLGKNRESELRQRIYAAVDEWPTDAIVFETASFGSRNRAIKEGHARLAGVIAACAQELGLKCWGYPPSQWKEIAIGKGNADKSDVARLLKVHYQIDVAPGDEADALGILMCAMKEGRPPESKKKAEKRIRKRVRAQQPTLFRLK